MLKHLLNLRLALLIAAFALAAFGIGNAFVALFSQARYEVTYQFSVTVSYCPGDPCAYSAMLEIANSGRKLQNEVKASIRGLPEALGSSPRTINLDASRPRDNDPVVSRQHHGDVLELRLQQLPPGALTQFQFRGFLSSEEMAGAIEPEILVEGRGRIIEGDPRSIAFGRWFTAIADSAGPAGG